MLFNPFDDKEKAGLLLFKDESHQYFLCIEKVGGTKHISIKLTIPE
jgi:alpha-N-arabinofuranosidase